MTAYDWLEGVLFLMDKISRPTLQNLCSPYESFQTRCGLGRVLAQWEKEGLIQREETARDMVFVLTDAGRYRVEPFPKVRDYWDWTWDGVWRTFLFDLPSTDKRLRMLLWRWLREQRFGYLQDSVWIRAHPLGSITESLTWFKDNPEMFVIFESRRVAGGNTVAIVQGAWDFKWVNDRYRQHLEVITECHATLKKAKSPADLGPLLRRERRFYADAIARDPLLPRDLWPKGYLGWEAFSRRQAFYKAARQKTQSLLGSL